MPSVRVAAIRVSVVDEHVCLGDGLTILPVNYNKQLTDRERETKSKE